MTPNVPMHACYINNKKKKENQQQINSVEKAAYFIASDLLANNETSKIIAHVIFNIDICLGAIYIRLKS